MARLTSRQHRVGAIVIAAVLVVGVAWWWIGSVIPSPPDPLPVTCEDRGLTELLADTDGYELALPQAPTAAAEEPEYRGTFEGGIPVFDYQAPGGTGNIATRLGYVLDPESATLSHESSEADRSRTLWETKISEEPLDDLYYAVSALPGHPDLLTVSAWSAEGHTRLLTVLDGDGTIRLACSLEDATPGQAFEAASLTPDGAMLLVRDVDEDERAWIAAHATDGGGHLWSVPGEAAVANHRHAFVAEERQVTAYDLGDAEERWQQEIQWTFDEDAWSGETGQNSEAVEWTLQVGEDDLYVGPSVGRRLVALDLLTGRTQWEFSPGDTLGNVTITRLDRDGDNVLLDFGQELVRRWGRNEHTVLRRDLGYQTVEVFTRPTGEPALILARPSRNNYAPLLTIHTTSSRGDEPLFTLSPDTEDYNVAVADTAVYVLNKKDRTVSAYSLETSDEIWSVQTPEVRDSGPQPFTAITGGFSVGLGGGIYANYRYEDDG